MSKRLNLSWKTQIPINTGDIVHALIIHTGLHTKLYPDHMSISLWLEDSLDSFEFLAGIEKLVL